MQAPRSEGRACGPAGPRLVNDRLRPRVARAGYFRRASAPICPVSPGRARRRPARPRSPHPSASPSLTSPAAPARTGPPRTRPGRAPAPPPDVRRTWPAPPAARRHRRPIPGPPRRAPAPLARAARRHRRPIPGPPRRAPAPLTAPPTPHPMAPKGTPLCAQWRLWAPPQPPGGAPPPSGPAPALLPPAGRHLLAGPSVRSRLPQATATPLAAVVMASRRRDNGSGRNNFSAPGRSALSADHGVISLRSRP
jgi:hypothetical protein